MAITYSRLKELAPKDTFSFIQKALPYMAKYITNEEKIYVTVEGSNNKSDQLSQISKIFFILLSLATEADSEINDIFAKYGYNKSNVNVNAYKAYDETYENLYKGFSAFIPETNDEMMYKSLTPLDILLNSFREYYQKCNNSVLEGLLPNNYPGCSSLIRDLERLKDKRKAEAEVVREHEIYGNLPFSVINYLETASKIRHLILNNKILTSDYSIVDADIVPLSLFLASFYYKESKGKTDSTSKDLLMSYFKSKGVDMDKINGKLYNHLNNDTVHAAPRNLDTIEHFYTKYLTHGVLTGVDYKNVTVPLILENVFNRSLVKSVAVEKLLATIGCDISKFDNLSKEVEDAYKNIENEKISNFYNGLTIDVKNYMEFTCKTYTLLKEKVKEGNYNKALIRSEDDLDTLALLIATYYFNADVTKFYNANGVTLPKVYKLIGINLTKAEIENSTIDGSTLVNKFNRFVREGNNRGKYESSIDINSIAFNLCDREFNKSMILEDIFNTLSESTRLPSNYSDRVISELELRERKRKNELKEKIFKNVPVETVEYFELVSKIHNSLKKELKGYRNEDIRNISMILGLLNYNLNKDEEDVNDVPEIFQRMGFANDLPLKEALGFTDFLRDLDNYSEDIDLISREYTPYIFGGFNENKDRKDITLYSVVKNIFNRELNNGLIMHKAVAACGYTYDELENFDEIYEQYRKEYKETKKLDKYQGYINSYDSDTSEFLGHTLKIIGYMKENRDTLNKELIKDDNDIVEASMFAALAVNGCNLQEVMEHNGLSFSRLMKMYGINESDLDAILYRDANYHDVELMLKYIEKNSSKAYNMYLKDVGFKLFEKGINPSRVIETICENNNIDYENLKNEIKTGEVIEKQLTITDRIELLENAKMESIDPHNLESILRFGTSLIEHSKYMYDELPKMSDDDTISESTKAIQDITSRIYITKTPEQKRGLLARIFRTDKSLGAPRITVDGVALQELKDEIDKNIEVLSQELLAFDKMRKYMEAYRRKNREHYQESATAEEELQEELKTLDPNDEDDFDRYLQVRSLLQIVNDKNNRFITTNKITMQDLLRINQAITNHFITINALEMAKNDLLPLIGSELAITQGRMTEEDALELSNGVIGLLRSLVDKNVGDTSKNIELIKNSGLPQELVETICQDVDVFIDTLNKKELLPGGIAKLDIDDEKVKRIPTLATNDTSTEKEEERAKQFAIEHGKTKQYKRSNKSLRKRD